MVALLERPRPLVLSPSTNHRRDCPRPPRYRQADYEEKYDATTVYFDCIVLPLAQKAVFLCPPFRNLEAELKLSRVLLGREGTELSFSHVRLETHDQIWVDLPRFADLKFNSPLGQGQVIQDEAAANQAIFNGKRVLFTLSKNNRLEWVSDWIKYHRDLHGANAVLIYDNDSTEYSSHALLEVLAGITGLDAACVVEWPFRYGPQGFGGRYWDSAYCQSGMMEHSRWKFLQSASSALNLDVDELLVPGERSIFEVVERSKYGYVAFSGRWAVGVAGTESPATLRHKDFATVLRPSIKWKKIRPAFNDVCPQKWAVVPSACGPKTQWQVHSIRGMKSTNLRSSNGYRHFRAINTNWKYSRVGFEKRSPWKHYEDKQLTKAFSAVKWE